MKENVLDFEQFPLKMIHKHIKRVIVPTRCAKLDPINIQNDMITINTNILIFNV